jgi:hypothetical protein
MVGFPVAFVGAFPFIALLMMYLFQCPNNPMIKIVHLIGSFLFLLIFLIPSFKDEIKIFDDGEIFASGIKITKKSVKKIKTDIDEFYIPMVLIQFNEYDNINLRMAIHQRNQIFALKKILQIVPHEVIDDNTQKILMNNGSKYLRKAYISTLGGVACLAVGFYGAFSLFIKGGHFCH